MAPRPTAVPNLAPKDREAEVHRAEQEALALELQLATEAQRLTSQAQALGTRAAELSELADRAEQVGATGQDLGDIRGRLGELAVPQLDIDRLRERALNARVEAVAARRKGIEAFRQSVEQFQAQVREASAQLEADAGALEQIEQTARSAAQRKKAAAAVAAAPAAAPKPAPVVAPKPAGAVARPPEASRREQRRVRMQAAVDFGSDSNFFTGFSTNISDGGLFVATVHALPRGTQVDLVFSLPSGEKVNVKGEVRWTREVNDDDPSIFPGVGVQFVDLPPEAAAQIHGFVSSREPLFFPD